MGRGVKFVARPFRDKLAIYQIGIPTGTKAFVLKPSFSPGFSPGSFPILVPILNLALSYPVVVSDRISPCLERIL